MRKSITLGILCLLGVSTARADSLAGGGDPFKLYFDEFGNGQIQLDNGASFTLQGQLMADPTGRSAGPVLTYILPTTVQDGDVRIWEDSLTSGVLSDLLVFTNANGDLTSFAGDRMLFISDNADGVDAPADTGFFDPALLHTADDGGIVEVGAEGNNGIHWLPGGVAFPANNEYIGISDNLVPLPSSAWAGIVLLGGFGLVAAARKRLALA